MSDDPIFSALREVGMTGIKVFLAVSPVDWGLEPLI